MFVLVNSTHAPPPVAPAERRRRLEAHQGAWRAMTLSQALDAAVEQFADRPLVITDSRTYSYREIQEWSVALAAGLVERGVRSGDHGAGVKRNR